MLKSIAIAAALLAFLPLPPSAEAAPSCERASVGERSLVAEAGHPAACIGAMIVMAQARQASCPAGMMPCAEWCRRFRPTAVESCLDNPQNPKSCMTLFGRLDTCVRDH